MKFKLIVWTAFLSLVSLSHQGSPPPPPSSSSSSWSFDSFPDAFWDPSQGASVVGLPTYSPEFHHHSQQSSTFLSSPPFHPEREGEQQQQQPARPSRRRNKAPLIRDTIEFPPNSAPLIDLIRARPTNVHRAHTQKSFATSFSQNDQVKAIDLEHRNPNQIAYAFSMLYPCDVDSVTKQRLTYAIREYLERSDLVDEEKKDSVLYHLSGLTKKSKLKLREENSVKESQREAQGHQPQAQNHHHRNEDTPSYDYLLAGRPMHQDQGQDNSGTRDKEHEAEEGGEEEEDANPFVAFFRQVGLPSTASDAIQVAQSFYPQSGYGQRQTTYRLMLFLYSHYPQGEVDRARRAYDQAVRATARNRRRIENEERVHSLSKSKGSKLHGSGSSSGGSGNNGSRSGTAHATAMEVDGGVENRYGGYGYAAEQQRAAPDYQHQFTEFPHWLQESGDHTSGGSVEEVVYPHGNTFGQQEQLYNSDSSDPNYRPHEHLQVHPSHQAHFLSPHSTEPVPEDYTFWYNMYQQTKDNPNQPPPI